eukprot:TRINITY_DN9943_c0_g1_i1.p1 TRINITY_DN9943_c0_g1~~TRINITY_DN9943_c0_g1_i1.p1  ORF type:complete len:222 (-),score=29.93 TRINITY_DN9943_c0_g1_i1:209-874(-)
MGDQSSEVHDFLAKRPRFDLEENSARVIRIGEPFQARVEPYTRLKRTKQALQEAKESVGELLWQPGNCDNGALTEYLNLVREMYGARDFSEEQALRALQFHNFNIEQALIQMFESPLPANHVEDAWTADDIQIFDKAFKRTKRFNKVAQDVQTHTVGSCVALYYARKNTNTFINTSGRAPSGARASAREARLRLRKQRVEERPNRSDSGEDDGENSEQNGR